MNVLVRTDRWLIDRIFQPLADRLARWWTCYEVAAFLLTGAGLMLAAGTIAETSLDHPRAGQYLVFFRMDCGKSTRRSDGDR